MPDYPLAYFITWTTHGTWLPGDVRGWRKSPAGNRPAQPALAAWSRQRLKESPVVLTPAQRQRVEDVCRRHADIRRWALHAISVRSNHIHVAVTAQADPGIVRDQFKANATRVLRELPDAVIQEHVWTRGGDIEFIDPEANLELVVQYVIDSQDRKVRDS